jgi:hypothetical protein
VVALVVLMMRWSDAFSEGCELEVILLCMVAEGQDHLCMSFVAGQWRTFFLLFFL